MTGDGNSLISLQDFKFDYTLRLRNSASLMRPLLQPPWFDRVAELSLITIYTTIYMVNFSLLGARADSSDSIVKIHGDLPAIMIFLLHEPVATV